MAAVVGVLLACTAGAVPAGAYGVVGSLVPVKVGPASPTPSTTITISFRLPAATTPVGPVGGPVASVATLTRTDVVDVVGPTRGGSCVSTASTRAPVAAQGATVHVVLTPSAFGGGWCTGRFKGDIVQSAQSTCSGARHVMCPEYLTVPQIIGRFHFTVTAG